MNNFLYPASLIPLLKDQKYADRLLKRFIISPDWDKKRILQKAQELNQGPRIEQFQFPKAPNQITKELRIFDGQAYANETVLGPEGFENIRVEFEVLKAVDTAGRFEFVIQEIGDSGAIVVCKVTPELRGKGLFPTMVGAIADYCFFKLQLRSVSGSARPPSTEPDMDWRCERTPYRTNFKTGEEVILTRLHQLWLSQPYAVHSRVLGIDDEDGFALLSPEYLTALPIDEIANLDKYHPKKEENSFAYLMEQKGVAL
jgi:RimJ/RimL family protein N-acetyltransferase